MYVCMYVCMYVLLMYFIYEQCLVVGEVGSRVQCCDAISREAEGGCPAMAESTAAATHGAGRRGPEGEGQGRTPPYCAYAYIHTYHTYTLISILVF